jgi:hypothetical protein
MSFQTMESEKSADVVGNSRIEVILYIPKHNQAKLSATKINLGIVVSHSNFPKVDSNLTILVRGVKMAMLVVEMEKMLSVLPDMNNIKAFIANCCPGFIAMAMALDLRFATKAAEFCEETPVEGTFRLRSAATKLA